MLTHLTTRLIIINIKRFLINSCCDLHLGLGTPLFRNTRSLPEVDERARGIAKPIQLRYSPVGVWFTALASPDSGENTCAETPPVAHARPIVAWRGWVYPVPRTLISYTRYYGVAYNLTVKTFKSEKDKY